MADEYLDKRYHLTQLNNIDSNPKLILLGSSTTRTGYDVRELAALTGLNSKDIINLGTMPNNPEISENLLKRISHKIRGAIVLYGLDPWICSENYYQHFDYKLSQWNVFQRGYYILSSKADFKKAMDVVNGGNLKDNLTVLLGLHREDLDLSGKDWQGSDVLGRIPYARWFNYPRFGISPDFMIALHRIRNICNKSGCELIVYHPIYSYAFVDTYNNLSFKKELEKYLSNTLHDSTIHDEIISMDDDYFWDGIHVKEKGKLKQTFRLAGLIKGNELLQ